MNIIIQQSVPSVDDYLRLREITGLSPKTSEAAAIGLKNSVFGVTLYNGKKAIGMGRIIGDGGCFYQIVDIAVDPDYQGRGLGKTIMNELMQYLEKHAPKSAYVSLIADLPADQLYKQFGFQYTYPKSVGMYRKF
jgi:ribosomal protein S18 acetylase RimI-like enzyme